MAGASRALSIPATMAATLNHFCARAADRSFLPAIAGTPDAIA
jgi:hypothetical protein